MLIYGFDCYQSFTLYTVYDALFLDHYFYIGIFNFDYNVLFFPGFYIKIYYVLRANLASIIYR